VAPALTERTVVRLEPGRWRDRAKRWQRVAREAAKQCGRSVVPEVETPRPLAACLDDAADVRLCLWEDDGTPLGGLLDALAQPPRSVSVVVGPEGGLTREEVETATGLGWQVARLGPRILRTETAGPALVSIVQFRFGDLATGSPGPRQA
jgi:16S rRNA (uracil1498-N3)-methyltransferase